MTALACLLLGLAPQGAEAPTPGPSADAGRTILVRSLKPKELRAALNATGPRTIRFAVSGVIDLEGRRLFLREPFVTLDGTTASGPGITFIRGGISIRTHHVTLRNLRIRPGDAGEPHFSGWEPDGIGIYGPGAHDILIEHCSLSWAVDENLGISSDAPPADAPRRITIRDCILAEGLDFASHDEGPHSRGALIRGQDVRIERNYFAHNARRNPVFRDGATGRIVNNLIYNPRSAAIHVDGAAVSVVGNVLIHGPDTNPGIAMVLGNGLVAAHDNAALDANGAPALVLARSLSRLHLAPVPRAPVHGVLPAEAVGLHVALHAGAWPRDAHDLRVLTHAVFGTGRIIDSQNEVGGYPTSP